MPRVTAARIALLGRVGIDQEGRPPGRGLPGRRAELVFAYLAAEHDRAVSRDALADALWPYALPDTWAAALRGVVTEVRRFLEDGGVDAAEVLVSGNGGYQLRLPEGVTVDLDEARTAFAAARERLAGAAPATAAAPAERASALAALPFLPQHEGEWVDGIREELASMRTRALELELRAHVAGGDRSGATAAAERLVRAEPFSEAAHQLRIRAHGDLGDRTGAIAAFEHYRALLAAQLRSRPTAETERVLREAIERTAAPGPRAATAVTAPEFPAAGAVLVVAHHEFQRRTAVTILRGLGVGAITEAADGAEALAAIDRNGPPDVIVSELELPDLDGVELLRRLAERDAAGGLILTTAMDAGVVSAVETLAEAYGLRLLGVVEKPVTGRRLSELLAAHRREAAVADDDGRAVVTAADIAAALDAGGLGARFRPLADLATGTVNAVTAIPGWEEASGGWTAVASTPGVLDAADGLAGRLAGHTLALAVALAARSAADGWGLAVAVPLPPRALEERDLPDRFAALAREHGVRSPRPRLQRRGAGPPARPARAGHARPAADQGLRRRVRPLRLRRGGCRAARAGPAHRPQARPVARPGRGRAARSGRRRRAGARARPRGPAPGRRGGLRRAGGLRPPAPARLPVRRGGVHRRAAGRRRPRGLGGGLARGAGGQRRAVALRPAAGTGRCGCGSRPSRRRRRGSRPRARSPR